MDTATAVLNGSDIERARMIKRRDDLRNALQETQQALQQTEQQRAQMLEVLLRQQGAIQVLEELLAQDAPQE